MTLLTKGEIEQALGRAALVEELHELDRWLWDGDDGMRHGRRRDRMIERVDELLELLWPTSEPEEPQTWIEKIRALPHEEARIVVELVLKRRPEVTPPEDLGEWGAAATREWLVEKIAELPEEERDTWTR